jgi:hypothetical protein
MKTPCEMMKKKELLHEYNEYARKEGITSQQINQRVQPQPTSTVQNMIDKMIYKGKYKR